MSNNLFKFGTGELTNDAVICWIANFANDNRAEYRKLAYDIINLFTYENIEEIKEVKVIQQFKKIDVLLVVNDKELVVIEDKVNASEHNNQLERYKEEIEKITEVDSKSSLHEFIENKKSGIDVKIHFAYLKIGNESLYKNKLISYDESDKNKYKYVSRQDLLEVFKSNRDIRNDILDDYIKYLEDKETLFNLYDKSNDLKDWSWGFEGYFSKLQKEMKIESNSWGYVSNSNGGFLGYWWYFNDLKYKVSQEEIDYCIYPQIEALSINGTRVVVKVSVEDESYQSEIRNYLWNVLRNTKSFNEGNFNKTIFNKGKSMTICERVVETKAELEQAILDVKMIIEEAKVILEGKKII